eukprot:Skav207429  [mRNA]  locus=scaffold1798:24428:24985:- [translate_table: standard]
MGSAMVLSLHCFSPPGVRSSLFVKVDECFYAPVASSVDPCGESCAFLCSSAMNDPVVKVHYSTRALSTCPPPSKERVILEGPVVAMGVSWFKKYVAHIQRQLLVTFFWADAELPRLLGLTSVLNTGLPCPDNCDSLHCPGLASRLEADPGKTLHGAFQNGLIFLAAVELSSKHGDIVQAWKHTSF